MKNKNIKAQGGMFGMSFSTLFSIILIIFFVIAAFIGIRAFLKFQNCGKISNFWEGFQNDVKEAWESDGGAESPITNKNLPSVDYICFANLSKPVKGSEFEQEVTNDLRVYKYTKSNTFLLPLEKACQMDNKNINYLDIEKITSIKNPRCFPVEGGRVDLTVIKNFGEHRVTIE